MEQRNWRHSVVILKIRQQPIHILIDVKQGYSEDFIDRTNFTDSMKFLF